MLAVRTLQTDGEDRAPAMTREEVAFGLMGRHHLWSSHCDGEVAPQSGAGACVHPSCQEQSLIWVTLIINDFPKTL